MGKGTHREGNIERGPRGFQQDIELAMGSDPIRAVVELVTNADDAYDAAGKTIRGKIRIEVERHKRAETIVRVKDRAGGMSADEMEEKLAREGERTSGFETGADRRGLFGRGAKDVVHFGPAEWNSVHGGKRSRLRLGYENAPTQKWELDLLGNADSGSDGTVVTLRVQPRFTVARHDNLRKALSRHFALRPMLMDREMREVTLVDMNQARADKLLYDYPRGRPIEDSTRLTIPGYPGEAATLSLWEVGESLDDGQEREFWNHSVLIRSGRAAYEIFDGGRFSREPWSLYLGRLTGYVDVPTIRRLIREYDDEIEAGNPPPDSNPVRLVKRDRSGLISRNEHPFVKALGQALESALKPHLERIRAEVESDTSGPIKDTTRRRLHELGRLLGKLLEEESVESAGGSSDGPGVSVGLSTIPSIRVAAPEETARVLIRYRPEDLYQSETAPCVSISVKEDAGNE